MRLGWELVQESMRDEILQRMRSLQIQAFHTKMVIIGQHICMKLIILQRQITHDSGRLMHPTIGPIHIPILELFCQLLLRKMYTPVSVCSYVLLPSVSIR